MRHSRGCLGLSSSKPTAGQLFPPPTSGPPHRRAAFTWPAGACSAPAPSSYACTCPGCLAAVPRPALHLPCSPRCPGALKAACTPARQLAPAVGCSSRAGKRKAASATCHLDPAAFPPPVHCRATRAPFLLGQPRSGRRPPESWRGSPGPPTPPLARRRPGRAQCPAGGGGWRAARPGRCRCCRGLVAAHREQAGAHCRGRATATAAGRRPRIPSVLEPAPCAIFVDPPASPSHLCRLIDIPSNRFFERRVQPRGVVQPSAGGVHLCNEGGPALLRAQCGQVHFCVRRSGAPLPQTSVAPRLAVCNRLAGSPTSGVGAIGAAGGAVYRAVGGGTLAARLAALGKRFPGSAHVGQDGLPLDRGRVGGWWAWDRARKIETGEGGGTSRLAIAGSCSAAWSVPMPCGHNRTRPHGLHGTGQPHVLRSARR